MKRIYSVMIKGRTLESRDLRELLARAVNEKRKLDRAVPFRSCSPVQQARSAFAETCRSAS
jgi:hypothetical protein